MNTLILVKNGETLTTTSIIAEGVKNSHDAVIKLVRKYVADLGEFGRVGFQIEPFETNGGIQEREIALLNEHQATLLLTYMRNTDIVREFKKRLVKAFFEMAGKLANTDLNPANLSRMQLIQIAMQAEQERLVLEQQVEEMKPDVQAFERLAKSDGSLCVTDAAKQLQYNPKKLFGFLYANEWVYKRTGSSAWVGYQDKLQQGLIEHKITIVQKDDGTDKVVTQVRITPKGMAKLAKMLDDTKIQTAA